MANATPTLRTLDGRGPSCPGPIADLVAVYRGCRGGDVIKVVSIDDGADTVVVTLEVVKP